MLNGRRIMLQNNSVSHRILPTTMDVYPSRGKLFGTTAVEVMFY